MTLPSLSQKQKYIVTGIAIIVAFATGRYSAQKAEIKTTITAQTNEKQNQIQDTHKQETITTIKTPDGTVKTVDQITEVADVKTDTTLSEQIQEKQDIIPPKTNTLNISALIGNDFSKGLGIYPVYGASVTKQILGPITIGAYSLTSGVVGVSIGLNF